MRLHIDAAFRITPEADPEEVLISSGLPGWKRVSPNTALLRVTGPSDKALSSQTLVLREEVNPSLRGSELLRLMGL